MSMEQKNVMKLYVKKVADQLVLLLPATTLINAIKKSLPYIKKKYYRQQVTILSPKLT